MTAERLYGTADMARALGTSTNSLVNRRARSDSSQATALLPPEPAYIHGKHDMPLWTRSQVEAVIAARMEQARTVLDGNA